VFGYGDSYLPTPTLNAGWFYGARKRACASDAPFPPTLTLHDLRHSAASLAITAAANIKAIQRMLGPASAAMTLDPYADLFDDDLDAFAAAFDEAKLASFATTHRSYNSESLLWHSRGKWIPN